MTTLLYLFKLFMVRALAFHQCSPGSIPGPGIVSNGLSLLVLYSAPRGLSPGTPVFPAFPKNQHLI